MRVCPGWLESGGANQSQVATGAGSGGGGRAGWRFQDLLCPGETYTLHTASVIYLDFICRSQPDLSSEDETPSRARASQSTLRTREDYRRGVEEVERSRASKARALNSNQRVREGTARKKREGGRADTDSGIHSSSSSFLEPVRGGQSFYRSYYWPSCCREAYGHQQFHPHPYYSRQAALSWQHLLLTTLPPAYLRLPPQTGTFPRFGGNPGPNWSSSSRYRRSSEHWGKMRQGRLVLLGSPLCLSCLRRNWLCCSC